MAQSVAALSYMAIVRIWYLPPAFRGSGPLTLTLTPALEQQRCVVVDQGGLSISSDRAKLFKIATSSSGKWENQTGRHHRQYQPKVTLGANASASVWGGFKGVPG